MIEVKALDGEILRIAATAQVSRYWGRCRLVPVTNYREFLPVGEDAQGRPASCAGEKPLNAADKLLGVLTYT